MPYIRPKFARQILGVTDDTLRSWADDGLIQCILGKGGHRYYDVDSFLLNRKKTETNTTHSTPETSGKYKYLYCRVSSSKQKADLDRQIQYLQSKYPTYTIVKDIASGLNFKRRGFQKLLEESLSGLVEEIVVAHRDRLCRFAWEHFEWLFSKYGTRLLVDSEDDHKHSPEEELASDLLDIIHVFSSRHYGQRRRILKTGTLTKAYQENEET